MSLTKETFLQRRPVKPVTLSDGQTVHLLYLPASHFIEEEGAAPGEDKRYDFASLIAKSLCDEKGAPFFAEGGREEVKMIPLKDFSLLGDTILEMNGLSAKKGDAPVAEKNSAGQGAA